MDFKYAQNWLLGIVCLVYGIYRIIDWSDESFDSTWANLWADWEDGAISGDINGMGETRSGSGDEGIVSVTRIDVATFVAVSE